jgi:hypothetical protein
LQPHDLPRGLLELAAGLSSLEPSALANSLLWPFEAEHLDRESGTDQDEFARQEWNCGESGGMVFDLGLFCVPGSEPGNDNEYSLHFM